jgi:hypothetical protein
MKYLLNFVDCWLFLVFFTELSPDLDIALPDDHNGLLIYDLLLDVLKLLNNFGEVFIVDHVDDEVDNLHIK